MAFLQFEEECAKHQQCVEIMKKVDICEESVKGKEGKNCLFHHARYWECIDHCVCCRVSVLASGAVSHRTALAGLRTSTVSNSGRLEVSTRI